MTTAVACPTCGTRATDPSHELRCAYEQDNQSRAIALGEPHGIPGPVMRDLYAHLRLLRDDGAEALNRVRVILDLGWRPNGGSVTGANDG